MRSCLFFLMLLAVTDIIAQGPGTRVQVRATDNRTYTAVIKEVQGNHFKVAYEGYNSEAWLTSDQFTVLTSSRETAPAGNEQRALQSIFQFGASRGWAGGVQQQTLDQYTSTFSATDKAKLLAFVQQAKTASARFFVLKSLLAGDDYNVLQKFIEELNTVSEAVQQERCLFTNRRSVIQQWQFSCSVTAVQAYIGDLSPRYAWEVKKTDRYNEVAPNPHENPMGKQQKLLLEHYGGKASPRGDESGTAIGILGPLNELVGSIIRMRFSAVPVTNPNSLFATIRNQLNEGVLMPLLIQFEGTTAAHFILVMRHRYLLSDHQYLIYDPWTGTCDWVAERTLLGGSLSPIPLQNRISLYYYYPATRMSDEEVRQLQEERRAKGF